MNRRNFGSLLVFTTICFWPIIFFLAFLGSSLLWHLRLSTGVDSFVVVAGSFLILSFAAILFAHHLFYSQDTWKKRAWIIYGAWLLITLIAGFVVSAAIGGMSMAVVHGGAGSILVRYLQYALFSTVLTIIAHVVIVPWVFIAVHLLKTVNRKVHLWANQRDMGVRS